MNLSIALFVNVISLLKIFQRPGYFINEKVAYYLNDLNSYCFAKNINEHGSWNDLPYPADN